MSDPVLGSHPAPAPVDPAVSTPASTPETVEDTGTTWFDAMTGRGPAAPEPSESGAEPVVPTAELAESPSDEGAPPQAEAPPPPAPKPKKTEPGPDDIVRLTRTQMERRIQAEVDRREAKRAADSRRQQQQDELDRKAREDPYGFAEEHIQRREQEQTLGQQTEAVHDLIRTTSQQFDRTVLDPIVTSLPPETQRQLVAENPPVGLEGRGKLVAAALAEIRKTAAAEGRAAGEKAAEQKLRKNPSFRKEMLAELRGAEDEPEATPNGTRSAKPPDMDDWLRGQLSAIRAY